GRNLGARGPGAAHVGEEVVAGRHRSVHAGRVDAPGPHAGGGDGSAGGAGVVDVDQGHQVAGLVQAAVVRGGGGHDAAGEHKGGGKAEQRRLQGGTSGTGWGGTVRPRVRRQWAESNRRARGATRDRGH